MKKREFIKLTGLVGAGMLIAPLAGCGDNSPLPAGGSNGSEDKLPEPPVEKGQFTLPELGYAYNALEPRIDELTMTTHHTKHHAGYVKKLNAALSEAPQHADRSLESLMSAIGSGDTALRNNGGGHYNHSLYWKVIAPGGGNEPQGELKTAIESSFGSLQAFADAFQKAAATRFGSGWAWLSADENKQLFISSTPNQDNPLMGNIVDQAGRPVLGIDVWEHAYYLNYQNRRGDYIQAFMELINWDQVARNFAAL